MAISESISFSHVNVSHGCDDFRDSVLVVRSKFEGELCDLLRDALREIASSEMVSDSES